MTNGLPFPLGAYKDKTDKRDFMFSKLTMPVQLPAKVDYEHKMSPVKDQGERGACVAFSVVAVKEYQEKIQRRLKDPFNFSEEWVYQQIMLPGGGAYIREGMKVLQKTGVPREHLMPYDFHGSDNTRTPFKPTAKASHNAIFYKARAYARLLTFNDMKQSLVLNGPFVMGIDWRYGWFYPNEFRDRYPVLDNNRSGTAGGHAITIVGYDDHSQMFKFKNSWGDEWGKNGYALLTYAAVENGLFDAWSSIDIAHVKNSVLNEMIHLKETTDAK